jgi:hypothetical protein
MALPIRDSATTGLPRRTGILKPLGGRGPWGGFKTTVRLENEAFLGMIRFENFRLAGRF